MYGVYKEVKNGDANVEQMILLYNYFQDSE